MNNQRAALEPSMVCVKNLILGMNCLFVMTGMLLIAVGSTIKGMYSNFDELIGSNMVSPATFVLVVGAIIFFVALFGCVGAMRESTCLINLYTLSLVVIFIFEFSAGLAGFALQTTIRGSLSNNMKYAIQHQYVEPDTSMANVINCIQDQLKCCGADSPLDWEGVLDVNSSNIQEGDVIVPNSCCGSFTNLTECVDPHTEGCLDTLATFAESGAMLLTGAAITVALIQAMGIYFSNELAKAIRRAKSLRTLRQIEIRNRLTNTYQPMNREQKTPAPVVYLAGSSGDATA